MEKPSYTTPYTPPTVNTGSSYQAPATNNNTASHWPGSAKNSFESALNRIRDQQAVKDSGADNSAEDIDHTPSDRPVMDEVRGAESNAESLEEVKDELASSANSGATQAASNLLASAALDDSLETEMTGSLSVGAESMQAGLSDVHPVESHAVSAPAMASGASAAVSAAETVAQMMARLERTPGSNNGQWHFGVLNEQAGVTALQLQRSVNGAWRVNVSFSETAQIDEQQHAEELKDALQQLGHDVDFVEVSKLASVAAPTDD